MTDPMPDPSAAPHRTAADSRKSRQTRARILETATRLFADIGYAAATNPRIAEEAGLTRGAMLYHFPSRDSLVAAAVDYIQAARGRLFEQAVTSAPHGADRTDHAIDSYWRLLREAPFVAFAELEAAARTDDVLRQRLGPAQEAFDRAQVGEHLFDLVQAGQGPRFQASRDLARFMLEGLAHGHLAYDSDGRTERLLAIVKRAARMLNRKGGGQDLWED
jgi:AcrR family transcriptional regulator